MTDPTSDVISALQKDFVAVGRRRVSSWKAWMIIGVATAVTLIIVFLVYKL